MSLTTPKAVAMRCMFCTADAQAAISSHSGMILSGFVARFMQIAIRCDTFGRTTRRNLVRTRSVSTNRTLRCAKLFVVQA